MRGLLLGEVFVIVVLVVFTACAQVLVFFVVCEIWSEVAKIRRKIR